MFLSGRTEEEEEQRIEIAREEKDQFRNQQNGELSAVLPSPH